MGSCRGPLRISRELRQHTLRITCKAPLRRSKLILSFAFWIRSKFSAQDQDAVIAQLGEIVPALIEKTTFASSSVSIRMSDCQLP